MKRNFSNMGKYAVTIVFAIFGLLLLMQHTNVFMEYDDFAYGCLKYVYQEPGVTGTHYTIVQLLHFLYEHWKLWGGRVLAFLPYIVLLKDKSTWVLRIVQCIFLLAIFVMFYILLKKKDSKSHFLTSLGVCALYGIMGLSAYTTGVYWFAASSIYVWTLLYVLLGMFFFWQYNCEKENKYIYMMTVIFSFLASFSMEQVSICYVVCLAGSLLWFCIQSKSLSPVKKSKAIIFTTVLGTSLLLLAPGNEKRSASVSYAEYYAKSLPERVFYSFKEIISCIFKGDNKLFLYIFLTTAICLGVVMLRRNKKMLLPLIVQCILAGLFIKLPVSEMFGPYAAMVIVFCIIYIVQLGIMLLFSSEWKDQLLFMFACGGAASVGCMLVSPIFGSRSMVPFMLLWMPVIIRCWIELFRGKKIEKGIVFCGLGIICFFSAKNSMSIYSGYKVNAEIREENRNNMLLMINADTPKSVVQKALPKREYAGFQLDERPEVFEWMKWYYGLDNEISANYITEKEWKLNFPLEMDRLYLVDVTTGDILQNAGKNSFFQIVWIGDEKVQGSVYLKLGDLDIELRKNVKNDVIVYETDIILGDWETGSYDAEIRYDGKIKNYTGVLTIN